MSNDYRTVLSYFQKFGYTIKKYERMKKMKKTWIILISILVIVVVAVGISMAMKQGQNEGGTVKIETVDDMKTTLDEVYKNTTVELPGLDDTEIDINDEYQFSRFTGLTSNTDVESVVISAPLINAQAYEVALIKVKDGANIEKMKQEIYDNINMNMWICVSADKLYITNYKNVIFLVMSSEDWAKPVYESFKEYVGSNNIGKELEKTQDYQDIELPSEMPQMPSAVVQ